LAVYCVLADGMIGLLVTLRLSGDSPVDFFAKLFWIKKRVFGYFFQKVTSLTNLPYFVLKENSQREFSKSGPSRTPVPTDFFIGNF